MHDFPSAEHLASATLLLMQDFGVPLVGPHWAELFFSQILFLMWYPAIQLVTLQFPLLHSAAAIGETMQLLVDVLLPEPHACGVLGTQDFLSLAIWLLPEHTKTIHSPCSEHAMDVAYPGFFALQSSIGSSAFRVGGAHFEMLLSSHPVSLVPE